ncbi:hypothetical protein ABZT06_46700 [Streptomyces sp. NPDC005483]|uniref:hypothetical protein n=1 Tax=Streptomyces sp. NPDC005483 TaxID=3154882 RepID=UPI0033BB53E8
MHARRQISRRAMLKATGATAVGLGGVATPSVAAGGAFAHPGLLHTGTDLARMAAEAKVRAAPCTAGCAKLTANPYAQRGCTDRPQAIVHGSVEPRSCSTWPQNYGMTRQPGKNFVFTG